MERIRMNIKRSVTWSLLAGAAACAALAATPGCELLVDFDRSKIPGPDASLSDSGETPDGSEPADGAGEGSTMVTDAGTDATTPAPDATTDGGGDGGDAAADTGTTDTGTPDTGADAASEAATVIDSGPDAIADAAVDGD
jgi:hypothetical protein